METAFSFLRDLIEQETGGAIVQGMSGFPPNGRVSSYFFADGASSSFV
jgi:hypothetical protein